MAYGVPGANPDLTSGSTFEINTITGEQLATMSPEAVRKQWTNGFRFGERNADPYMKLEGTGLDSLIQVDRSPANGKGSEVVFKVRMHFSKQGKKGDGLFINAESYETPVILAYNVYVDLIRHATSLSDRVEEINGLRNEIKNNDHELQGIWMGEQKCDLTESTMLLKAKGFNTSFAGGRTWNTLTTSHTLGYDDVLTEKEIMKSYVRPAELRRAGNNSVKNYLFACPSPGLSDLEKELIASAQITEGDVRGEGNFIFSGGWVHLRGQTIMERDSMDEARQGPLGTPGAPRARLGVAISAGTSTFDIKGNWNANWAAVPETQPFKWFPGHSYQFSGRTGDTFDPASNLLDDDTWAKRPRYVKVINVTGQDRGKWNMYSFGNSHNGEALTVVERLGSADSGAQVTTLGSVTWDSAKHTDAHPEGSVILPCTANGTTYVANLVMGAQSLMRAYGAGIHRESERFNGLVERHYIGQYFGQAPTFDVAGRMQGFRVLISAARFPQFKTLD